MSEKPASDFSGEGAVGRPQRTTDEQATMMRLEARSFANTLEDRAEKLAGANQRPEVVAELRKAAVWIRWFNGDAEAVGRPQEPPDRLRELANEAAFDRHEGARAARMPGHTPDFEDCPHADCVLVRALGRVPPAPAPHLQEAPVWLVELGSAPPQWWTGRGPDGWTPYVDGTERNPALTAMRFARREDAERAMSWLVKQGVRDGCKATEHLLLSSASLGRVPPAPSPHPLSDLMAQWRNWPVTGWLLGSDQRVESGPSEIIRTTRRRCADELEGVVPAPAPQEEKPEGLIQRLRSRALIETPDEDADAEDRDYPAEISWAELAEMAALLNEAADALSAVLPPSEEPRK